jgi:hypothetical protein
MRASGVRGLLVYGADYRCIHYIAISGDRYGWMTFGCLKSLSFLAQAIAWIPCRPGATMLDLALGTEQH